MLGAHLRKKQHRNELAESKKRIQDGNRGLCSVNGQNYFNFAEIMNKT